jgi:MPBQ/MSBQ methyltransferase
MLFPGEDEYRRWFERAGFAGVEVRVLAPDWYRGRSPYGVAVSGIKPASGPSPLATAAPAAAVEDRGAPLTGLERLRFAGRFALGSAAGAAFVPIGLILSLRSRLARRG